MPAAAIPPQHSFAQHRGYVAVGADLLNGSMTIGAAQELCNSLSDCLAITMSLARTDGMLTSTKYLVFLKASATWDAEPTHFTLVKQRPLCADIAYRPMSPHGGDASARLALSTGRGPYCCEGAGCPSEDEYDQAQFACEMPALSPRGVPRCANLRGVPLPNLALASAGALAAISSAYPFTENAGANAAVDGRLDGRYFHTRCDGSPQWFNLTFSSPISAEQIALHNRPLRTNDLLYRLVGSTVTLYGDTKGGGQHGAVAADGGGALLSVRVDVAREMYVWTLQPAVQRVRYLTVRLGEKMLPAGTACLHLSEVEVFGTPQSEFDARGSTVSRLVPESPPPAKPHALRPPFPVAREDTSLDASMDASVDASVDVSVDASVDVSVDASGHRGGAAIQRPSPAADRERGGGAAVKGGAGMDGAAGGGAAGVTLGGKGGGGGLPSPHPRGIPERPTPIPRGGRAESALPGGGWVHAACAGSATAAALLVMQALWVKSNWIDTWS